VEGEPGPALTAGATVGPYRVVSMLGEGGMGCVYRAVGADGEEVALKLLKGDLLHEPMLRKRFAREARAALTISHPHIVQTLDVGEHQGQPYMAQRFVEGGSLADRLAGRGPLDVPTLARLCLEIAAALDALHQAGLVHRDLKPANIMLDFEERAYVTDFGIAKIRDASVLTKPGQALGSLDYMAPEQIRGDAVSARTDVYALGCVTYECIAGRPPFGDREGRMKLLWAHLEDQAPDPASDREDVPDDVSWAVAQALAKEPAKRPETATAFARILQVATGTHGIQRSDG
jgi:serine/threonine protein kinase